MNNKLTYIKQKVNISIFISKKANEYSKYIVDIIVVNLNHKIIYTQNYINADIIISHITDKIKLFDNKSLNIIISGESRDINDIYDIYIGTKINTKAIITLYIPYLYLSLYEHKKSIQSIDYINNKKFFCAYMYSYDVPHRIKYFDLLNKYKKVEGLGKSCNNINHIENKINIEKNETYLDQAVKIYTNYKFVLALENFFQDGYFTEKIINPLIANSIPIYWGTPYVFKYINKKRVIYIQDYENDNKLLEKIIEIDNNDIEYNKIISEPIFLENKYPENIMEELENKIKKIFE